MTDFATVVLRLPDGVAIGDRFRIARVAARMKPREAANALGLSQSAYQRIEAGSREPRAGEVIAFAAITGQDVAFFGSASSVERDEVLPPEPARVHA